MKNNAACLVKYIYVLMERCFGTNKQFLTNRNMKLSEFNQLTYRAHTQQ